MNPISNCHRISNLYYLTGGGVATRCHNDSALYWRRSFNLFLLPFQRDTKRWDLYGVGAIVTHRQKPRSSPRLVTVAKQLRDLWRGGVEPPDRAMDSFEAQGFLQT